MEIIFKLEMKQFSLGGTIECLRLRFEGPMAMARLEAYWFCCKLVALYWLLIVMELICLDIC
jgi:hypothetical protein